jgi:hypothetical protein
MSDEGSILDKILTQERDSYFAEFNPIEMRKLLLTDLKDREADVINKRFGLLGEPKQTLEEIGSKYAITRERVRQIEISAIKKLIASTKDESYFTNPIRVVKQIIEARGGIVEQNDLLEQIVKISKSYLGSDIFSDPKEVTGIGNLFIFSLNNLWNKEFKQIEPNSIFKLGWRLSGTSTDAAEKLFEVAEDIIKAVGQPISETRLVGKIRKSDVWKKEYAPQPSIDNLSSDEQQRLVVGQLKLSQKVRANIFNEWGMADWSLVKPKRMTDKIFLILKRQQEPLHFRDIARLINEADFDKKKAYPPTIHNELILDKRYVLIGRGIYALSDWGYFPGTVAQVIARIIEEAEEAHTREQIVEKVLKQRLVNQATIHLALTNKQRFVQNEDGTYTLKTD